MPHTGFASSSSSGMSDKELIHKFPGTSGKGHFSFPSPFFDIASQFMPRNIKDMFRWCTTPETKIFMRDGSFKEIQNVQVGDEVLTETGEWKPVLKVLKREVDEDIYKLKIHGFNSLPIKVTGNHEVPTLSGRKRIDELTLDDHLMSAPIAPGDIRAPKYPPYILGMYAGDGYAGINYTQEENEPPKYFVVCCNINDQEQINKLTLAIESCSKKKVTFEKHSESAQCTKLICRDPKLAQWLSKMCPGKAKTKKFNKEVFSWNTKSISELLGGLRDSDGCTKTFVRTTSRNLAFQVLKLGEILGAIPSICEYQAYGFGVETSAYKVAIRVVDSPLVSSVKQITSQIKPRYNSQVVDGKIYRKIDNISLVPYKGLVYTLTVKDIHSYSTDIITWYNCEFIYLNNGVVANCIERTVKYPITNIQFGTEDSDIQQRYEEIMNNRLGFRDKMGDIGIDLHLYGNAFVSIHFPFTRFLKCPKCKMQTLIRQAIKVRFEEFKFKATCRCKYKGLMGLIDRPSRTLDGLTIKRWNPHYIDISYNSITGSSKYYYTIPPKDKLRVKSGDINFVADLPAVFFDIIKNDKTLALNSDSIMHLKTSSLSGLSAEWGIPQTLRSFKLHYYNAILRRANEAIALDYLTPIRVMYPDTRGDDVGQFVNMNKFKNASLDMIRKHRLDPGDAYFFPFPVGYQPIGGEGKTLNLMPEIKLANEEIMNSMGFPQQLFYGDLTVQSAPVALRLLENTMSTWIDGMNKFTQWTADKLARYYHLPRVTAKWADVTLVDDLEKKNLLMQLVGAQKIADDSFLSSIGTSVKDELRKRYRQMELEAELEKEFQEKQNKRSEGDPNSEGGGGAASLQGLEEQASQLAEMWLQMPYEQRRVEMGNLSEQDPPLYALASKIMERMRDSGQAPEPPAPGQEVQQQ